MCFLISDFTLIVDFFRLIFRFVSHSVTNPVRGDQTSVTTIWGHAGVVEPPGTDAPLRMRRDTSPDVPRFLHGPHHRTLQPPLPCPGPRDPSVRGPG